MYVLSLTVVILCCLPGPIWSSPPLEGLSQWCDENPTDPTTPRAPRACCTINQQCDVFINPKSEKYGINNRSSWIVRLCSCEDMYLRCVSANVNHVEASKARIYSFRQSCLKPLPNSNGGEVQYSLVNYRR